MRNLLINLIFIFTLLIANSTNVFSQILGSNQSDGTVTISQVVTISIKDGDNTINRRGGIVVPITGLDGARLAIVQSAPVAVEIAPIEDGFVAYTHTSPHELGWSLIIPDSIVSTWESGTYRLTVKIGGKLAISEEFTIE